MATKSKKSQLGYMNDNFNETMRRLAKEEARRAEQGVEDVNTSRALVKATQTTRFQRSQATVSGVTKARSALLSYTAQRVALVSAGQGVVVKCKFSSQSSLRAYYDRKLNVAVVEIPTDFLDHALRQDDDGNLIDRKALEHATRVVLGIGYHEVGHCRFSPDFNAMLAAVDNDPDDMTTDGWNDSRLFRVWNGAEDGRMETLVARNSPRIANYLTHLILYLFAERNDDGTFRCDKPENYTLISARRYLPRTVRAMFRTAFVAKYGDDLADRFDNATHRFMIADADTLVARTVDLAEILREIGGGDDHGMDDVMTNPFPTDASDDDAADGEVVYVDADEYDDQDTEGAIEAFDADMDDDDDDDDDDPEDADVEGGDGSADSDDESDDEAEGDGADGDGDSEEGSDSESDDDSGTDVPEDSNDGDGFSESGDGASDDSADDESDTVDTDDFDLDDDSTVEEAVSQAEEAASDVSLGDPLGPASTDGYLTGEQEMRAEELADQLVIQMLAASSVNSPHWMSRVDHGVLDAFAYRTRQRGDLNFYKRRDGDKARGFNANVSVLLDTSYSMNAYTIDLSIAAHAIRRVCDQLEIPCTIVTFSTGSRVLYRAGEATQSPAPRLTTDGGTDPEEALMDLDRHRPDADTPQIVFFFTDGAFSCPVQSFAGRDNRTFVGIAYKTPAYGLKNNGIRDARELGDLMDLPVLVGDALLDAALSR